MSVSCLRPRIVGVAAVCCALLVNDLAKSHQIPAVERTAENGHCKIPNRGEVQIPAGTFLMGSAHNADEGPVRRVSIVTFWMDRFDVTNAEFSKFVAATGYVTDAERRPEPAEFPEISPDKLEPGGAVFEPQPVSSSTQQEMEWWRFIGKADWRHPYGPNSNIVGHENDPVVQVSFRDALAYAHWAGRELPTEEQYEYAARGGLEGKTYSWGDEFKPSGKWMANVWQGDFPNENIPEDGYRGIAPVGCFPPNGYGLYDMVGNVWKWTSSMYARTETSGTHAARVLRTIKGGSFLCSTNYCQRFRPSARQPQESGFSSMHLGFRTVRHSESR